MLLTVVLYNDGSSNLFGIKGQLLSELQKADLGSMITMIYLK